MSNHWPSVERFRRAGGGGELGGGIDGKGTRGGGKDGGSDVDKPPSMRRLAPCSMQACAASLLPCAHATCSSERLTKSTSCAPSCRALGETTASFRALEGAVVDAWRKTVPQK